MIPVYVVYQKNKGQGHDCFFTFFRPTTSYFTSNRDDNYSIN
jgi:hypothetical protein